MDSLYVGPVQALSSPKAAKACLLMYCVSLLSLLAEVSHDEAKMRDVRDLSIGDKIVET